ncbi:hypothetical protein Scep_014405 [Stephania cephalantha]|uniref:Uncharacterized protein n=1 Tax=Stephania cephalantha TaxID=152367 RepID=A0AAP0P0I3_9MAGN
MRGIPLPLRVRDGHWGGRRCSSETETAVATPTRSSGSGEDATQAVARLGGAAGTDD